MLIPTDFSVASRQAIQYAFDLLQDKKEDYRFLLLHTYLIPSAPPHQLISLHDELRKKSLEGLEKERLWAQTLNGDHSVSLETLSSMGSLENVVNHLVDNQKIDCIIMGMERVNCPLLVIPSPKEPKR